MATAHGAAAFDRLREQMAAQTAGDGVGGLAWAVSVGAEVASGAAGWLDPDRRERPMPVDGVFRIASVSKPIVAVAALALVEEGLAGLDEPVDDVLPELANRRVLTDPHGPLDQATTPAERPLTLRDLLSFRCGLGIDFDFAAPQPVLDRMWEWGIGPGPTPPACEPDEFMAQLGRLPLADQPGTRWRYHTGSDIVSVFIERVRRETLDVVLARDVFAPIGVTDTGFWVRPDQLARFGACRMAGADGALVIWDGPEGRWSSPPRFRSGAAGLVSTTADLVAFGRMLLSGGAAPGGRVLAEELINELTTDQLTDDQRSLARIDDDGAAVGWGLGVGVRREAAPSGWPSAGAFGWDGGLGSRWLVDPAEDVCAVILSTDAFTAAAAPALMTEFTEAVAAVLAADDPQASRTRPT
ncbi:MAG: serine hydrolase domain-containing protein [Acidimicrobiales bacterium]